MSLFYVYAWYAFQTIDLFFGSDRLNYGVADSLKAVCGILFSFFMVETLVAYQILNFERSKKSSNNLAFIWYSRNRQDYGDPFNYVLSDQGAIQTISLKTFKT